MPHLTVAHFVLIFACACSAWADDSGMVIADRVQQLRADTAWKMVGEIPLQFDVHHPQGLAIVEGELWVSSVEVIDRAKGEGKAHLYRVERDGTNAEKLSFLEEPQYHPGGLDFDGTRIWMPVAEYRPDSTSFMTLVDPKTWKKQDIHESDLFPDHLGALVHDPVSHLLVGFSWGSRYFYQWSTRDLDDGKIELDKTPKRFPNRSHYIDLQDAQ